MLVKKGCMILGCHSPAMFHDYRLRGGSGGNFSLPTTLTNYELSLAQIAMESPDPSASRLIAKNLVRPDEQAGGRGIMHRGGALLDDFGVPLASPAECAKEPLNAETGPLDDQHAYCVIAKWIQIEQAAAKLKPLSGVIYVKRKPVATADLPQEFANYSGGSDLCFTPLTMDPMTGAITPPAAGHVQQSPPGCAGLSAATADIRHPTVSWGATRLPSLRGAARPSRTRSGPPPSTLRPAHDRVRQRRRHCRGSDRRRLDRQRRPIHNFDPVFTPDDRIVFASTRGNVMNTAAFDYHGPTHTPADPSRWNANLYILESGKVRQLTFLLNQELSPSMMSDGRLIFTAEKRAPSFYQLAGRRMNLDGGDYHPLFAQRKTVGFEQMTEVVELANKNLAAIFSDQGSAHGAGTLGLVNRSLGPDQLSARSRRLCLRSRRDRVARSKLLRALSELPGPQGHRPQGRGQRRRLPKPGSPAQWQHPRELRRQRDGPDQFLRQLRHLRHGRDHRAHNRVDERPRQRRALSSGCVPAHEPQSLQVTPRRGQCQHARVHRRRGRQPPHRRVGRHHPQCADFGRTDFPKYAHGPREPSLRSVRCRR